MPDPSPNLEPITGLTSGAGNDNSNAIETRKNELANQLLQGEVDRNEQRKIHRKWLFRIGLFSCLMFYALFGFLARKLYREPETLADIPAAWAIPLMGMLAIPTVFLIVFVVCLYRERPKVSTDNLVKALLKAVNDAQG